jgi:hypothetical protein
VVFVCAVLGELDYTNPITSFLHDPAGRDPLTTLCSECPQGTRTGRRGTRWTTARCRPRELAQPQGLDESGVMARPAGRGVVLVAASTEAERHVDELVRGGKTARRLGSTRPAPRGVENVDVTGGALWPQGGSWNPTVAIVTLAMDLADQLVPQKEKVSSEARWWWWSFVVMVVVVAVAVVEMVVRMHASE